MTNSHRRVIPSRMATVLAVATTAVMVATPPSTAVGQDQASHQAYGRWIPAEAYQLVPSSVQYHSAMAATTFVELLATCDPPAMELSGDYDVSLADQYWQVGSAWPTLDCGARFDRVRLELRVGDDGSLPTSNTVYEEDLITYVTDSASPGYRPLTAEEVNDLVASVSQDVLLQYEALDVHGLGSRMWWQAELHLVTSNGHVGFACARLEAVNPENPLPLACDQYFTPPSLNGVGL